MTTFRDELEKLMKPLEESDFSEDGNKPLVDEVKQAIIELVDREIIEAQLQLLRNIDNSETRFNHGTIELLAAFKQQLNQQRQKLGVKNNE